MPIIDFSLGGRLIDAVSETAYDLDGNAHTYDFTIMQIATVTAFDPFSIWPPAQPTIRILFDGAWPFLDVHIGDELVVEGPTVLIYTSPADKVPPLSRALRNTSQVMISKIRWWIKHDGGRKKAAMTKLTDQFVAAKLSFDQWLQAQGKLFNDDLPPIVKKLSFGATIPIELFMIRRQAMLRRLFYCKKRVIH
ncbi:hypothetical protein ACFQ5J_03285 [Lacticaseibacillus baoqingensis]|uniref:Phage tail protein n=1 Tax=Lacticaseibacillus baoqingensis TaxID=2486013 RepID=A0ABW4E5I8_9LACO|nr:hypothetical protein [Lacticaseibacillus baoqingensis]